MTAGLKDLRLIRAAAEGANCPVEIADAIVAKMEAAIAERHGGQGLEFGSGNHAQAGGTGREARRRLARGRGVSEAAQIFPSRFSHAFACLRTFAGAVPP